MKKILLLLTILSGIILVVYGVSLIIDYMVTTKYHVESGVGEPIIYTVEARANEIKFITRYFYCSVAFGILAIISSVVAIFAKS